MDWLDSKTCPRCGEHKQRQHFGKHSKRKDGMQVYCLACMASIRAEKQYDKKRWALSSDREKQRSREYRSANAERLRQYWRNKADRQRADNPGKKRSYNIARKHSERRATPPWADMEKINEIYIQARMMKQADGIPRHVDHVVPLRGTHVCGLHVHWNLQILTETENSTKSNRFTPG